jgi:DNA-binding MarR family transcriptional regulator
VLSPLPGKYRKDHSSATTYDDSTPAEGIEGLILPGSPRHPRYGYISAPSPTLGVANSSDKERQLIKPCNCYSLRKATRRVTQLYDRLLAPLGLRATQFTLLMEVERRGPISLIPLADAMVMDRATLGHNIRPLEAVGYLALSVGRDRRSREVSLTKSGRKILAEAKPLWQRAQAIFESEIGLEEAAGLRTVLKRVAASEFPHA